MAQNLKINGKQYNGVAVIGAPNANGGTARFYDTSNATADADDIAIGKTAYTINGKITGTNQGGGSTLGTKTITSNGEYDAQDDGYDGYSSVDVQVPGSSPTLQVKTNIAPTTSSQTITADQGYDGLSSVQINAMPTGTAGTPTATKGAVSNHSISVTPSVTNSAGYISSGTINGTAVTVSASELDSGAKSITANGNSQDVVGYASVNVNVPNTYAAGDEGKVVSSGALVAQTAHADVTPTTSDQTIDTTTNNSLKVKGDANLVAGNIKKDVEIFGTTGSYEGGGGISLDDFASGAEPTGAITINSTTVRKCAFSYATNITSVTMPNVTTVGQDAFSYATALQYAYFGGANFVPGNYMVRGCTALKELHMPYFKSTSGLGGFGLQNCTSLELIDYGNANQAAFNNLSVCPLNTIILRKSDGVVSLPANALNNSTAFQNGGTGGTIYIPKVLYDHLDDNSALDYKAATNWSAYDGYGTITWAKIEGSAYEL